MKSIERIILFIVAIALLLLGYFLLNKSPQIATMTQREWLTQHMNRQLENGPRLPNSKSHDLTVDYINEILEGFNWKVIKQSWKFNDDKFTNIIAYDQSCDDSNLSVIGAHFDSRIYADHDLDSNKRNEPVLGANDGASGVAVLLELARVLEKEDRCKVSLVFFDAEDNGGIQEYSWIMGSKYFVEKRENLPFNIKNAVIIDMIGDKDLDLYYEKHSDKKIREAIWKEAENIGYNTIFIQNEKHSILDDHIPFIEADIPAVDIIDFDYEYWHTTNDTIENVSIENLQIIVEVLNNWIHKYL